MAVWMAVAAIRPFLPALPAPGLDPSWITVLGETADRRWRMGVDIVFPYGPASSLVTHYLDRNYFALTLPLLLAVCLAFGFGAVLMLGPSRPPDRARGRALAVFVATFALVVPGTVAFPDAIFLVLPLLPVILMVKGGPDERLAAVLAASTAALVGAVGLAKASFPIAAVPLFLLTDAATLARRRVPALALPFLAGFLAADVAYGQNLSDLPAYLGQQALVAVGYADAMALDGSRIELLAFCGAAALLLGFASLAEWRGTGLARRSRVVLPLAVAVTMWTLLKAGFIRQDLHTIIAWSGLAVLAWLLSWARLRHWRRDVAATVLTLAVVGSSALIPWTLAGGMPPSRRAGAAMALERDRLIRDPEVQLMAAWDLAGSPRAFAARQEDAKAEAWRRIAEGLPLPKLDGRVDTIPSVQSAVIANGLDYRPRPNFQEYSTFSAPLLDANRAFLHGPEAPDWLLFGREPGSESLTLDHRYPNLAEGALWPDLMRLYAPGCSVDALVALRRRPVPADLRLGVDQRTTVRFDDVVPLAPATGWLARITVHPTLLGRLSGLLFKPAPVVMTVGFADGRKQDYQLITGIAEAGFVLSPLVNDAADFVGLSDGRTPPPDRTVTSFSLHVPPRLQGFFSPAFDLSLESLAMPPSGSTEDLPQPCPAAT